MTVVLLLIGLANLAVLGVLLRVVLSRRVALPYRAQAPAVVAPVTAPDAHAVIVGQPRYYVEAIAPDGTLYDGMYEGDVEGMAKEKWDKLLAKGEPGTFTFYDRHRPGHRGRIERRA